MFMGLPIHGDYSFSFTNISGNHQESLRQERNRVVNQVSESWGISDGHILVGLEFLLGEANSDTMFTHYLLVCPRPRHIWRRAFES